MADISRRIKNCNKLYLFLLTLAIFTGCWCFLLFTIPVLCRMYYLYKLKGIYESCSETTLLSVSYNRFQQSYEEYCR